MKKKFLKGAVASVCLLCALASCGTGTGGVEDSSEDSATSVDSGTSSQDEVKKAALLDSYILGQKVDNAYRGYDAIVHQVNLYSNNVYEYIQTSSVYAYSQTLSQTVQINYGTYAKGASEDGVTEYSLNKAARIVLNAYSKMGGFTIDVDTDHTTFPADLRPGDGDQKVIGRSKEDAIEKIGLGFKIFAEDGKSIFSFSDAEGETPANITTASGDISSLFVSDIEDAALVSKFSTGSYGAGSWNCDCNTLVRFADGSYEYVTTTVNYGYGQILGVTTNSAFGKVTKGASEDGVTAYKLNKADNVANLFYTLAGGSFLKTITAANQTYPTELPAVAQGEKNMVNSKEEVIAQLGAEKTVYTFATNNELSLTNPNE